MDVAVCVSGGETSAATGEVSDKSDNVSETSDRALSQEHFHDVYFFKKAAGADLLEP